MKTIDKSESLMASAKAELQAGESITHNPKRRSFLQKSVAMAGGAGAAGTLGLTGLSAAAATLEGVMTRLMGHVPHSSRFLAQTRRPLSPQVMSFHL